MVEPSGDSTLDLERALRELAAEDRGVRVPDHVQAAVMDAWDARAPRAVWRHRFRRSRWLGRIAAMAATAAALMATVALYEYGRRESSRSAPPTAPTEAPSRPQGIVLVADPVLDPSALTVVRVRVRRATLAHLGLTLADPDATGLVDLEVLVGEDGTARTIRRVVPVATADFQE
jgi:hypothetical protein